MDYIEPDSDEAAQTALQGQDDAALHHEALKRFDQIVSAVQEERALALRDRRFCTIAGAQWEGIWGEQFENSIMVEVNKTAAGVEKIISDYRANRFMVDFRASDDDADDDTSDLLNGMFRADLDGCCGQEAIDMAFEEAVQGGIGAWRLANDWEDEYDPDNEHQRIKLIAIPDADQRVFYDPNAKLYDKSDARYAFVLTAMGLDAYEEQYGENPGDFPTGLFKTFYDWYTPQVAYIAEYYEIREKTGKLYVLRNKATKAMRSEWAADLDQGELTDLKQRGWDLVRTRTGKRRQVWKTILSGSGVLVAPKLIAGRNIPVVPVYGKRWFIDNMERSRGHVRLAVDPQRIYNAQISKLTETAALAPIERPIVTPEQIAGHETSWAEANLKRAPYALLNALINPDGSSMPAGPIAKIEPPALSPVLSALIQITAQDINDLTTAEDGADQVKANVSAEAMDLAAQRTDSKAEIYMDNLRKSMRRCGQIYLSMATDVYVEEGRSVPVMDGDGQHDHRTLLEAYADDKGFRIRHDIARGKFEVVADVSEATTTRRDKTVKTLLNVAQISLQADPQLAAASLNTAMVNMDGEGMHDLKDWVRQRLIQQGVLKPTEQEQADLAKKAQAQQQQQPPSPEEQLMVAKAAGEQASAQLDHAKTILTLAQAKGQGAKTDNDMALARLESVHAQQDQAVGHMQAHQGLVHAHEAHVADMMQAGQGIVHAEQAHRVGLIQKVRNMFAPKPQGMLQ